MASLFKYSTFFSGIYTNIFKYLNFTCLDIQFAKEKDLKVQSKMIVRKQRFVKLKIQIHTKIKDKISTQGGKWQSNNRKS